MKPSEPLKVDPEFAILMQPVLDIDTDDLAIDLLEYGCKEPIITWHGYILDGHKRYRICQEYNIPYETQQLQLDSRASALQWICCHLLKKNHLVNENRKYLIGKRYELEKTLATREINLKHKNEEAAPTLHQLLSQKAIKMSDEYHISIGTVKKYNLYSKALDKIASESPHILSKIRSGQLRISHENVIEISRFPAEDIHKLSDAVSRGNISRLNYSGIRHEIAWKRYEVQYAESNSRRRQRDTMDAGIKKMPLYDPDAEVSSLTLTIPSWISSISRAHNNSSFELVSPTAKAKLLVQLTALKTACEHIALQLKEANHE